MANMLRNIPSVNELLESPPLRQLVDRANRNVVVSGVRTFLDNMRQEVTQATADIHVPSASELAERIADWINSEEQLNLRPVVNATGILLHTGLGRAPLAQSALKAVTQIADGYASLEVNIESGQRSQRVHDAQRLIRKLTGAEAAVVVNNNAGATLLALSAIARDREVVVSRGQLVEIGGSYRLPDVMEFSGTRLREVGTTNKTRISDFANAIGDDTGALMRVHTSNYAIVGFTEQPTLAELVALGRKHDLPVIDDIGSGAVHEMSQYGVPNEPLASASLQAGADIVLFSGDKLLGGPQCGIIAGRSDLIKKITQHPLTRALRVGKLTLAALVETLRLHQDQNSAEEHIPLYSLLSTPVENLENRASRIAPQMAAATAIAAAESVKSHTFLGGGSVPSQKIDTWCVALTPATGSVDQLAHRLRAGTPSIFGRIQQDRLMLDLRSVFPRQDVVLVDAINRLDGQGLEESAPCESDEKPDN